MQNYVYLCRRNEFINQFFKRMETVLTTIMVIFGILNIILFFKIWGMTNNVRKIEKHLDGKSRDIGDTIRLMKMQGKTQEQIQQHLTDLMAKDIVDNYSYNSYFSETFKSMKKQWGKIFDNAGVEMPYSIKKLKTAEDYINL